MTGEIPFSMSTKQHTHCQIPVDLGDPHVKVETEENQQDPSHHKCTAAYELKKVEAFAWGTLHDGLDADECNQSQNLARKLDIHVCIYLVHIYGHTCLLCF